MMKGNEDGRNYVVEDRPCGGADRFYAVVDNPVDGHVVCFGRMDDVGAYLRENGYGSVFCRVRVYPLH